MYREIENDLRLLNDVSVDGYVPSCVWTSLLKTIKVSLLPEIIHGEDRPSEEGDFVSFRKDVVYGFKAVCNFINKVCASQHTVTPDRDCLLWSIILCGEHSSSYFWTSEDTRYLSTTCVKAWCSIYSCTSLSDILLGRSPKASSPSFKSILLQLRPKLLHETWRRYPGAVSAYKWIVCQVHSPNLSEYVGIISPTSLLILDDHIRERRLIGLQCLSHIIDNVARTELCQLGLHQVFYKALEPMLWQRDADQIEPVITCLTKLLLKTERGYTRSVEPGMWDLCDDTLQTLLDKMAFEDQIPLRKAYINSLSLVLSAMGPATIRWSKPLLLIFDEYLTKESYDTRKSALEALKIYLQLSTPRIHLNGDNVLFLLLRTLLDLTEENDHCTEQELLELISECVTLIRDSAPLEFQYVMQEIKNEECYTKMKSVLSKCMK